MKLVLVGLYRVVSRSPVIRILEIFKWLTLGRVTTSNLYVKVRLGSLEFNFIFIIFTITILGKKWPKLEEIIVLY